MNSLFRSLFFILAVITGLSHPVFGQKAAYKHYYKGALCYLEGEMNPAEAHFKKAYTQVPDNFYFATAYGMTLHQTGHYAEGKALLQRARRTLRTSHPDYKSQLASWNFFTGIAHLYSGQAGFAINPIRKAIDLTSSTEKGYELSVYYNALGYAYLLNQGQGAHRKAGLAPHYHVHQRDMERSARCFEKALQFNPDNLTARNNYQILADTLGLPEAAPPTIIVERPKPATPTFSTLPEKIERAFDLSNFEEVLFLVDISGSMVMEKVLCLNQERFEVMKEMAIYIAARISDTTRLGLATIGGDCPEPPMQWLSAGALSKNELVEKLEFLYPDGTTPLLNVLVETPTLFSKSDSITKAIFLISDGENVCRIGDLDICKWAEGLARQKITVHVLTFLERGLENTGAFAEYTCLAENTGGKVAYIDNYKCSTALFDFNLLETCNLQIPKIERSDCFPPSVKAMWAIFPDF